MQQRCTFQNSGVTFQFYVTIKTVQDPGCSWPEVVVVYLFWFVNINTDQTSVINHLHGDKELCLFNEEHVIKALTCGSYGVLSVINSKKRLETVFIKDSGR